MNRPPLPPFTAETAEQKARQAEDAWNTRDPARVALAYTTDSRWRNRAEFLQGREAIQGFLTRKWNRELDYRLIKEVLAFHDCTLKFRSAGGKDKAAICTIKCEPKAGFPACVARCTQDGKACDNGIRNCD